MMSSQYEIQTLNCDLCDTDNSRPLEVARAAFAELFVTGTQFKAGVTREQTVPFHERFRQERAKTAKRCFYFLADCGGDSIAICGDCLSKIAREVSCGS